jgi:thiol-disulfide isomerase/thioredoxin
MLLAPLLILVVVPQEPAAPPPATQPVALRVALAAKAPAEGARLSWSPKGAAVGLQPRGNALCGEFPLGPEGTRMVAVELTRSAEATHHDQLAIDLDRDGAFTAAERRTTTPKEQRGKWWSSFEATLQIPAADGKAARPYPMDLWFVTDPAEPDARPQLRWSRRGWHEGTFEHGGQTVHVLITEAQMDGVFTTADAWQLGADREAMLRGGSRKLDLHAWCHGRAFRVTDVAADGSAITVEPFDPGITEQAEKERDDKQKADRAAKRAPAPLAFGKDLAAALAEAQRTGKRVFADFETTWCGPCKQMDQWIYTAADVVTAATETGVITVKLDGDEQKELVKRYEVKGYPTLLLLDAKGDVLRRATGYQGVAAMVQFFAK